MWCLCLHLCIRLRLSPQPTQPWLRPLPPLPCHPSPGSGVDARPQRRHFCADQSRCESPLPALAPQLLFLVLDGAPSPPAGATVDYENVFGAPPLALYMVHCAVRGHVARRRAQGLALRAACPARVGVTDRVRGPESTQHTLRCSLPCAPRPVLICSPPPHAWPVPVTSAIASPLHRSHGTALRCRGRCPHVAAPSHMLAAEAFPSSLHPFLPHASCKPPPPFCPCVALASQAANPQAVAALIVAGGDPHRKSLVSDLSPVEARTQ